MENHKHRLSIRLTDNEYNELSTWAKSLGDSRGKFVRVLMKLFIELPTYNASVNKVSKAHHDVQIMNYKALGKLDKVYPVLYGLSNNVNQITKAIHRHEDPYIDPKMVQKLKQSLNQTYSIVKEALRYGS